MALKGNLPEMASRSFQDALASNPYIWEAFEGLCALGTQIGLFPNPPNNSLHCRVNTGD